MAELVGHDSGHLAFGVCRLDHPSVDVHRPARQRECVDFSDVDDGERVVKLRLAQLWRNRLHQPPANPLDVGGHLVVADDR